MFAAALDSENDSAGVVVAFATDVVNSGLRLPAEKDVTVPPVPITDARLATVAFHELFPSSNWRVELVVIEGCAIATAPAKTNRIAASKFFIVYQV